MVWKIPHLKSLLFLLPRVLRARVLRSSFHFNPTPPKDLTIKLAESKEELEGAFSLLKKWMQKNELIKDKALEEKFWVGFYHALPSTSILIALRNGEVVGTLSIVRNNIFGLPIESHFEVSTLKRYGARIAEVTALAFRENENKDEIIFPLFKYLYEYCIHFMGVDYLLISIQKKLTDFYSNILLFDEIPNLNPIALKNGKPSILNHRAMYLDLRLAYKKFAVFYGGKGMTQDLFHYIFTTPRFESFIFPNRTYFKTMDPVMTPELLDYFFNRMTQTFSSLTDFQKSLLFNVYDREKYGGVLPEPDTKIAFLNARAHRRFHINCHGRIYLGEGSRMINISVKDASKSGFAANLSQSIRFGHAVKIHVAIGQFDIAQIEAFPVWTDNKGVYGFSIIKASDNWNHFLLDLEELQLIRKNEIRK